MSRGLYLSLIAVFIQSSLGAIPVENEIGYLVNYGYLKKGANTSLESPETIHALKKAQGFGNIPQTGQLDEQTLKYFRTKRCSLSDYNENEFGGRWDKKNISFGFLTATKKLSKSDVLHEIERALKKWGYYSGHSFFYQPFDNRHKDILVGFLTGDHGDEEPFKGKNSHVAHAFYPPHAEAHLNDDETYSIYPPGYGEDGIELYSIMLHLMGHAMGLQHSSDKDSIMHPTIRTNGHLRRDDIEKIQKLYPRIITTTTPSTTTTTTPSTTTTTTPSTTTSTTTTTTTTTTEAPKISSTKYCPYTNCNFDY